jgi:hypothetical protein
MTEPPNPTGPAALPQALHGLSKSLGRSTERGPTGARRQREGVWLAENRDAIAAWNDHVRSARAPAYRFSPILDGFYCQDMR